MKVIVTGNPRSGTSFVCQLIHHMGLCAGLPQHLKPADQHNLNGYWEYLPLASITDSIFNKLNIDFLLPPQLLERGWHTRFNEEKKLIKQIVERDNIEVYKDNKLLIASDLYHDLFPTAKWILVTRNPEDCFNSRWGKPISRDDYVGLWQQRHQVWFNSTISLSTITVNYQSFHIELADTIKYIAKYLTIDVEDKMATLKSLFKPRQNG